MVIPSITRRAFMKGIAALAGKSAIPKTVSKAMEAVTPSSVNVDSAPWIQNMVGSLKNIVDNRKLESLLPNGAEVRYVKAPANEFDSHTLSIKTADGDRDFIKYHETKGDIDIEFDIRDDYHNNQHIYVNKKTGATEIVDDNYYMTGPEDYAKDDPIVYDATREAIRKKMMLADEKPDDYMYDYMSMPDDSDYGYLFERYADTFSPSGGIFKTKQFADNERAKKLMQEEMDELMFEQQFRDGNIHGFNKGGVMKDVVPPLDGYAAGGVGKKIIQRAAPKLLDKLREFAPQITGKVDPKPFTVFDNAGLPVKDFKTYDEAMKFAKEDPNMLSVGNTPKPDVSADTPAMFFRSREELIQGPPMLEGQQWLNYFKSRGIRDAEMMDTSLGPFLNQNLKNKISKNDLVKKYDETVPDFDVQVLGQGTDGALQNMSIDRLRQIDPAVFSAEARPIITTIQNQIKDVTTTKAEDQFLGRLDNLFDKAYGIPNVSKTGIPADNAMVPFEIKQLMNEILAGTGRRGAGFKAAAFVDRAKYSGQQTLPDGSNYREFVFSYKPKGPRKNEPVYSYAHQFGAAKTDNAFMHARVSDRTDEFGNRLLFVEEFQSDMHQPISRVVREATQQGKELPPSGKYAPRLDVESPALNKANLQQMELIQRKIDKLLETNPNSPKLAKLYEQKEEIRNIEKAKAQKSAKDTSGVPEGPFKNSQDYMEFAIKYLMRVAKDGNYDGVAFSTPAVKNRNLSPGSKDYQGNLFAYGNILNNAIRKAKAKTGADLFETSIGARGEYRGDMKYYGVPALMIKGNKKAMEKISKGLPAYAKGGLTKTTPPEKGPQPYGIMQDVVSPL